VPDCGQALTAQMPGQAIEIMQLLIQAGVTQTREIIQNRFRAVAGSMQLGNASTATALG